MKKYTKSNLSLEEAIIAKCADCCGMYADGQVNCGITKCPLYTFTPFEPMGEPNFEYFHELDLKKGLKKALYKAFNKQS